MMSCTLFVKHVKLTMSFFLMLTVISVLCLFFDLLMSLPGKMQRWLFSVGPSMPLVFGALLASKPRDLGAAGQPWLAEGIWSALPLLDLLPPLSRASHRGVRGLTVGQAGVLPVLTRRPSGSRSHGFPTAQPACPGAAEPAAAAGTVV